MAGGIASTQGSRVHLMDARAGLIQSGYLLIAYTVHVYKRGNVQQYLAHHLSSVPCGSRGQVISDCMAHHLSSVPCGSRGQVISDCMAHHLSVCPVAGDLRLAHHLSVCPVAVGGAGDLRLAHHLSVCSDWLTTSLCALWQ